MRKFNKIKESVKLRYIKYKQQQKIGPFARCQGVNYIFSLRKEIKTRNFLHKTNSQELVEVALNS